MAQAPCWTKSACNAAINASLILWREPFGLPAGLPDWPIEGASPPGPQRERSKIVPAALGPRSRQSADFGLSERGLLYTPSADARADVRRRRLSAITDLSQTQTIAIAGVAMPENGSVKRHIGKWPHSPPIPAVLSF